MSGWRWNPRIAAVCLALFLVVQLTIPLSRMIGGDDDSQRFGWQMFTAASFFDFEVVTPSGVIQIDPDDVLAKPRGDMHLDDLLPPYLCAIYPEAIRVTWSEGELEC